MAYDRKKAVDYAHEHVFQPNPAFYDFSQLGGDCTNFASQCLYAGGGVMNFTPVFGWYYISLQNRAPAWTGVQFLYNFLMSNEGPGPYAEEVKIGDLLPGDLVQLSFNGEYFQHTPVVVRAGNRPDRLLLTARSVNSDNRPLSTYPYQLVRYIHIIDVRGNGMDTSLRR